MAGFFSQLKAGLSKTRQSFVEKVEQIFTGRGKIDEELYEELEEVLIRSDVGVQTSMELVENLRKEVKTRKLSDAEQLKSVLEELIVNLLGEEVPLNLAEKGPSIILVVGVNGVGKTTSIGKLAQYYQRQGRKVVLAAGDTFRAVRSMGRANGQ